jgi:hypothetical protein
MRLEIVDVRTWQNFSERGQGTGPTPVRRISHVANGEPTEEHPDASSATAQGGIRQYVRIACTTRLDMTPSVFGLRVQSTLRT